MHTERDLASKRLALEDLKNSYIAEASTPVSTVDELHQEISVCSLLLTSIHKFIL